MSSLQNAVYQSIYEQIKDPSKVNEMLPDINPYQMVDHHKKKQNKKIKQTSNFNDIVFDIFFEIYVLF